MKLSRSLVAFLILLSLIVFAPLARAQDDVNIDIDLPSQVAVDQEVTVTIEITDADDELVDGADVSVSFDSGDSVLDDELYDCGDPNDFDECQVNNRGVDGVFEVIFFLAEAPVTMTVTADGVSKAVQIGASSSSSSTSSSSTTSSTTSTSSTVSASSVQVGPYPSVLLILIPLALMCGAVTYVVVKS